MQRKILNSKINYICEKHRYFDELRTVGSYSTTIFLKFLDLWPYYRAIEITWNVQRS